MNSSSRDFRAEKRRLLRELEQSQKRVKRLEEELDLVKNEDQYMALEDMGRTFYQDAWNRTSCSSAIQFTSPASFTCLAVEDDYSSSMPGVHDQVAMEKGIYSQSIWLTGEGYTLVGLVSSDKEKAALKFCRSWSNLPFMSIIGYGRDHCLTIYVDMINRKAQLYRADASNRAYLDNEPGTSLEPEREWDNLPDRLWVAVAMKRNSMREAILLPCTHWEVEEIGE